MTNDRFAELFGAAGASPEQLLTQFHMDIAASIQAVLEEVVLRLTRSLASKSARAICAWPAAWRSIASPTARCCATAFDNIWIQPAAGDAGGAVGAALAAYHCFKDRPRSIDWQDGMSGAYLGPAFPQATLSGGSTRRARNSPCSTKHALIGRPRRR